MFSLYKLDNQSMQSANFTCETIDKLFTGRGRSNSAFVYMGLGQCVPKSFRTLVTPYPHWSLRTQGLVIPYPLLK